MNFAAMSTAAIASLLKSSSLLRNDGATPAIRAEADANYRAAKSYLRSL